VISGENYRGIPDAFVLKLSQNNLVTVSEQIPNATFGVSVSPNPSNGQFNINVNESKKLKTGCRHYRQNRAREYLQQYPIFYH
jgi:hypothetical protein